MNRKKPHLIDSLIENLDDDVHPEKGKPKEHRFNSHIDDDYEYSRTKYRELLDHSSEAIELMMNLARESEHPRAFEVLSGLLKHTAEINGELMQHHKITKDVKSDGKRSNGEPNQQNIFIGSTTELQKYLMKNVTPEAPKIEEKKKDD